MAAKVNPHRTEPTVPYTVKARRERSRDLAQKRRTTYKSLMQDLATELPFTKDVVNQVDYNSRLRLAMCFFRMKHLMYQESKNERGDEDGCNSVVSCDKKPPLFREGMLQSLITEALDGFMLVTLADGTIIYLSESIHKHLGLFQSEHIGFSLYDLVLEEDHGDVREAISKAEAAALARLTSKDAINCTFFCRMKCSRFKVANTVMKSPGYKLVFVSGQFKASDSEPFLVTVVRPVSPPSILEIRMEGNMFVTHYTLEMKCTFFDGRLNHLMGFSKNDLIGHVPFEYHHHADIEATLECSRGIMTKGEGLSGYYRFMNQFGQFIWLQSRATLMFDSRTGKPSYIVCMNFVISKELGEKTLNLRRAIANGDASLSEEGNRSHEPFPVPREDGKLVNPLEGQQGDPLSEKMAANEEPHSTQLSSPVKKTKLDFPTIEPIHSVSMSHGGVSSPPRIHSTTSPASSFSATSVFDSNPNGSLPRSDSSSPEQCMPDSTVTCSTAAIPECSAVSSSSDLGYKSASSSSMNLSPDYGSVSSYSEHMAHGTHWHQPSPESYQSSVFSPNTSLENVTTPSSATSYTSHPSVASSTGPYAVPSAACSNSSNDFALGSSYMCSSSTSSSFCTTPDFNAPASSSPLTSYATTQSQEPSVEEIKLTLMGRGQAHLSKSGATTQSTYQQAPFPQQPDSWTSVAGLMKPETRELNDCQAQQMTAALGRGLVVHTSNGSAASPMVILDGPLDTLPQLDSDDLKVLDYLDQLGRQEIA